MGRRNTNSKMKRLKQGRKNRANPQENETEIESTQGSRQLPQSKAVPEVEITVPPADMSDEDLQEPEMSIPSAEAQPEIESPTTTAIVDPAQIEGNSLTTPPTAGKPRSASASSARKVAGTVHSWMKESWEHQRRSFAFPLKRDEGWKGFPGCQNPHTPTPVFSPQLDGFTPMHSSQPPRLSQRRAHHSSPIVPTLSSAEVGDTSLDATRTSNSQHNPRHLPLLPKRPERQPKLCAGAPDLDWRCSAIESANSTPAEQVSDLVVDDKSVSSLTQIEPVLDDCENDVHVHARDAEAVVSYAAPSCIDPKSNLWFTWTRQQQEVRIAIDGVPCIEEARRVCEPCHAKAVVERVSKDESVDVEVFICDTCGRGPGRDRLLCQSCAREAVDDANDQHKADHVLRSVGPRTSFSLHGPATMLIRRPSMQSDQDSTHPAPWLDSELAFRAMTEAETLLTRIFLKPPEGSHQVTVNLCIKFDEDSISSKNIGPGTKQLMKTTNSPYGEIDIGVEAQAEDTDDGDMLSNSYLPPNAIRTPVVYKSGQYKLSLSVPFAKPIELGTNGRLVVHVKSTYKTKVFKSGCPYRWSLDSVKLEAYGKEDQFSTQKQKWNDELDKSNQKKENRATRNRHLGYLGAAVGVGLVGISYASQALNHVLKLKEDEEE